MAKEFSRKSRIDVQMQRELVSLIQQELADPRLAGVTILSVDVAPDMRNARIGVSLMTDEERLPEAVKVLNNASSRLRRGLGPRLGLRYTPELRFVVDTQLIEASRINLLIRQARQQDDLNADERGDEVTKGE